MPIFEQPAETANCHECGTNHYTNLLKTVAIETAIGDTIRVQICADCIADGYMDASDAERDEEEDYEEEEDDYGDRDEPYDYGFDMPDTRQTWYLVDGSKVTVEIVRSRTRRGWDVSWVVKHDGKVAATVAKNDEGKACEIAIILFGDEIDKEATESAEHDFRTMRAEDGYRCGY